MRPAIRALAALPFISMLLTSAFAENSKLPYVKLSPATPPAVDKQQLTRADEEMRQRKAKQKAERSAIIKRIADEELARAKYQHASGAKIDPYAVADMRTNERKRALEEQWKSEDDAERASIAAQGKTEKGKAYNTQNYDAFFGRQMKMLKEMGGTE